MNNQIIKRQIRYIAFFLGFGIIFSAPAYGQLNIQGHLFIQDDAIVHVNTDIHLSSDLGRIDNIGTIQISGDFSKDELSSFESNPSEGDRLVSFIDSNQDESHLQGNFTDDASFFNLEVNKSGLLDINEDLEIKNSLNIIDGILRTDTISEMTQNGNLYSNRVLINNNSPDAIIGLDLTSNSSSFVEGRLARLIFDGEYVFPVGVNPTLIDESQPIKISSTSDEESIVEVYFQNESTTLVGIEKECDLGVAPDYDIPDGTIENVVIDCTYGQWVADSEVDFDHDATVYPSEVIQSQCGDAVISYLAINGEIEDCPSFGSEIGIMREGLQIFGIYDVATASEASITTSVIEIDGKFITASLYPNPTLANTNLNLQIDGLEGRTGIVSMYNILGFKIINDQKIVNGKNTLSITDVPSGNYLVQIIIEGKSLTDFVTIR